MHALARRRTILELLQDKPYVTVEEAGGATDASPATIRRDFADLARQGLVVRGHGGVHRMETLPTMGVVAHARRASLNPEAKARICQRAVTLLSAGDVVIIDGGSTTTHFAHFLPPTVRVITNSLALASALNDPAENRPMPEVNVTGGYLSPKGALLMGPQTVHALEAYSANWAFLSCGGIDADGIYNSNDLLVDTERAMIARAKNVAFLVEVRKFGVTAMVRVCSLRDVDVLVTDEEPPTEYRAVLEENGVRLLVAGADSGRA